MSNKRFTFILVFLMSIVLSAGSIIAQDDTLECDDNVLEIWQVQGAGDVTPCDGDTVLFENNIVTTMSLDGFFMQTPDDRIDGDMYTSDGIYVFTNRNPANWGVAVGDLVNVRARIEENFGLTQAVARSEGRIEILSSGNALPEAIDLLTIDLNDYGGTLQPLERYEGMYVRVDNVTATSPTNRFDEFGVTLTGERAFREAGIEWDDYVDYFGVGLPEWDLNPELLEIDPGDVGMPVEQVTVGSTASVVGGLGYAYTDYRILPSILEVEISPYEARPVREREAGEFTIATQNVENFFDTTNDPNREDNYGEDYTPANEEEYQLRLTRMSEHVRVNLGAPDILAIQEIEGSRALTDLIFQINADDPSLRYAGCILEGAESRGIDSAYIVRVERVNIFDCYRTPGSLDFVTELGVGTLFTRPPLVLEAEYVTDEGDSFPLTIVNVHLRSLNDVETERVQFKRMLQAMNVANFVQSVQEENPDVHMVVLGDFNGLQFTDGLIDVVGVIAGTHNPDEAATAPADDLVEPNLTNQAFNLPEEEQYSYIFNGNLQILDHILTSEGINPYVTGAMYSRGNADAPEAWFMEDVGAVRTSDHDGMVLYVNPELMMDE